MSTVDETTQFYSLSPSSKHLGRRNVTTSAACLFSISRANKLKYEPAFDGLRAVAIIFVFLDHAWWEQYKLGHTLVACHGGAVRICSWPALLTFIFARRAICCILGLIVVMVTWRCFLALNGADPNEPTTAAIPTVMPFLIGCLLALLVRQNPDPAIKLSGMWIVASGGLLAILFLCLIELFLRRPQDFPLRLLPASCRFITGTKTTAITRDPSLLPSPPPPSPVRSLARAYPVL